MSQDATTDRAAKTNLEIFIDAIEEEAERLGMKPEQIVERFAQHYGFEMRPITEDDS